MSNGLKRRQNLRVLEAGCFKPHVKTEGWLGPCPAEEQCRGEDTPLRSQETRERVYHAVKNKGLMKRQRKEHRTVEYKEAKASLRNKGQTPEDVGRTE